MPGFSYDDGLLRVEGIEVDEIAAAVGTPTYVYSAQEIRSAYDRVRSAFSPLRARLHYAVKASSNLHLCRLLRGLGAGMDVVSGGELERAWLAGAPMSEIVFAGVGKTDDELRAALDGRFSPLVHAAEALGAVGIEDRGPVGLFNVESESELERLTAIAAELGITAHACIRVNPNVDARTHEYTTTGKKENKFGIDFRQVPELFGAFAHRRSVELVGLHVHIGSPVREVEPYVDAVRVLLSLADTLDTAGHRITTLDLGGGWAIDYHERESPGIEAYADALTPLLQDRVRGGLKVLLEPGRSILGNAGVLLTRVQHVKQGRSKRFVICDAGIHTLIRPALYQAFHFVWPTRVEPRHVPPTKAEHLDLAGLLECDVVGPICETGDFLARSRPLPPLESGDLLAVFSAGAYGMSMSSNYNDHGRPAEVLVDEGRVTQINRRQSLAMLLQTETEPQELALGPR